MQLRATIETGPVANDPENILIEEVGGLVIAVHSVEEELVVSVFGKDPNPDKEH